MKDPILVTLKDNKLSINSAKAITSYDYCYMRQKEMQRWSRILKLRRIYLENELDIVKTSLQVLDKEIYSHSKSVQLSLEY